jgi:hypothetical protein
MRPRRAGVAALLLLSLVACSPGTGPDEPSTAPAETATSPTPTPKQTAVEPVRRNGRITTAERYLGEERHGYDWRDFDPVSGTGLFVLHRGDNDNGAPGLAVLGRAGRVATLTCRRGLPCSPSFGYVATLGPGADGVTVASGDGTAQVIGYDGALRRTIDLTATVTGGADVRGLRWSPDGGRLAVLTNQNALPDDEVAWAASRVWLVDRDGSDAQLAYSLVALGNPKGTFDASEFDARGSIWFPGWSWSWSPDGQALLLDVLRGGPDGTADNPVVLVLHLPPNGTAYPVVAQTLYHSDRSFDWWGNVAWSPDGTRVAVRTRRHITEISAEDGSVSARHPHDAGWLIWPKDNPQ